MATEREYGSRGVAFIAASLDDWKTRKNVPKFVNEYHVSFPVWVGATGDDLLKLGMEDGPACPRLSLTRMAASWHASWEKSARKNWLSGLNGW